MQPCTSSSLKTPYKRKKTKGTPSPIKKYISKLGLDSSSSFVSSKTSSPKLLSPNVTKISNEDEEDQNLSKSYMDSLKLSPEQPVKRKARKNYQFVKTFDSLAELDSYIRISTKKLVNIYKYFLLLFLFK